MGFLLRSSRWDRDGQISLDSVTNSVENGHQLWVSLTKHLAKYITVLKTFEHHFSESSTSAWSRKAFLQHSELHDRRRKEPRVLRRCKGLNHSQDHVQKVNVGSATEFYQRQFLTMLDMQWVNQQPVLVCFFIVARLLGLAHFRADPIMYNVWQSTLLNQQQHFQNRFCSFGQY